MPYNVQVSDRKVVTAGRPKQTNEFTDHVAALAENRGSTLSVQVQGDAEAKAVRSMLRRAGQDHNVTVRVELDPPLESLTATTPCEILFTVTDRITRTRKDKSDDSLAA